MMVSVVAVLAGLGLGGFSTTFIKKSVMGDTLKNYDNSFVITNSGVTVATSFMSGPTTGTDPKEIISTSTPSTATSATSPPPIMILRTNAITKGHYVYKAILSETANLEGGIWTLQILQSGSQIGDTITIQQSTPNTKIQRVTILADLGTSIPDSNAYDVKVTQVG